MMVLIIGLFIGGTVGFLTAALLKAAKDNNEKASISKHNKSTNKHGIT